LFSRIQTETNAFAVTLKSISTRGVQMRPADTFHQARNQGGRSPPRKFFAPPGKMCWTYSFKKWTYFKKSGPPGKLFAPPGVPSWLRPAFHHGPGL